MPSDILDSYVGTFASPIGEFLITRNGAGLDVKLGGQPAIGMKPVSNTEFEIVEVGAKLTFGSVADGKAQTMILEQRGQKIEAKRK